MSTFWNIDKV